jgi:hypothetical protein
MVSEAGSRPTMPAFLYVYVKDTDTGYRRALEAGARTMRNHPTHLMAIGVV